MKAVDGFFGAYVNYLTRYDHDSLLHLLGCLDILEEELQNEHNMTLQIFPEYVPLDALRRYWNNNGEVRRRIVLAQVPEIPGVHTDLPFLCLIDDVTMEKVIEEIDEEYREDDRLTIYETIHVYGNVVNIGQIIFNISSLIMGSLIESGIEGTSKNYKIARETMTCHPGTNRPITFSGWFEGEPGLICSFLDGVYTKAGGREV